LVSNSRTVYAVGRHHLVERNVLVALADGAAIGRELHVLSARELRRVQERILLLIKSAQERTASFLLEMAERATTAEAIELPMSRQEIADYLGLTIETVTRTLPRSKAPTSRRIVLRNRRALNRMHG
jgi:CRP/FNR family nitrogen fixation transcriptional regulator